MHLRTLAACCLFQTALAVPSHAFTGKTETRTDDGDARMELGEYTGLKHSIGCKDFENEGGWRGPWELGNNLSIMLESALLDTGRFVLVEREKLGDVLLEQDLSATGRTAPSPVARTGRLRPARYIGTGAITEVDASESGGSVIKATSTGEVIINRGSEYGLDVGRILVMATEAGVFRDPDTGDVLGREEGKVIGKLKVAKVRETIAYCEVLEGEAAPAPGTRVRTE